MLVETRCGTLFVEKKGDGPDLVLWHSLLCDGGMWREQLPALTERFTCVNIDAPGHGRSGIPEAPYSMDDCVDAALRVLDAVGLERVAWCGLSWGGMVGMRLAARHPDRIAALVLMDTSARAERPVKKLAYRPLAALARNFGPVTSLAKALEPIFFSSRSRKERRDAVEQFVATLTRMDKTAISRAVDAVIFSRDDVSEEIRRIDVPTLVFVGAEDRATPPSEAQRIVDAIDGAEMIEVPAAGHLSAWERPDVVNPALIEFLERCTQVS